MASALSVKSDGIAICLTSPVSLKNPFTNEKIETRGIWDTGATNSVITKSAAQKLGLMPIGRTIVNGVHGMRNVNVYYVDITLNNDRISLKTQVTECEELSPDHSNGMLIGMNIITMGDLCITNSDGSTILSFVVPSQRKIDFVEEINDYNKILKIHQIWIKNGNKKCPCHSGKDWNNCHGKISYK